MGNGLNEADRASGVAFDRRLGRAPSLTPGREESSAFIPDPDSASENSAQSEPERLREGLGGLLVAAGCWVGMTTYLPAGARRPRNPRGDALRGRIKGQARKGRVTREPVGARRWAAPETETRVWRDAKTQPQGPHELEHEPSGAHRIMYQLVSPTLHSPSRTATATAAITLRPRLRPPRSLGSPYVLLLGHWNYSATWTGGSTTDTYGAQRQEDYNSRRALGQPLTTDSEEVHLSFRVLVLESIFLLIDYSSQHAKSHCPQNRRYTAFPARI